MEEITIVIPNYNGEKYLEECLEALEEQEVGSPKFKVLVVDNGSDDGSVSLLNAYMEKTAKMQEPHIFETECIFLNENTGFCHAVNVGIQEARSPYVILLNNDTKVKAGFIKSLYKAINSDEKIFSVSSKMLMWDKPELIDDAGDRYCVLGWAYSRGKGKKATVFDKPADVFAACGGASIYRRSVFDEIGLFDELHFAYLEDIDIGYRAKIHGYRNRYEPSAEVLHYGSASTGSRYNERKTQLASANSVYIIGKNMPFLQCLINLPFLVTGFFLKFLFFCRKGMGMLYLKGLGAGVKRSFSKQGRMNKESFALRHLGNYIRIQLQLYVNTLRIIMKS